MSIFLTILTYASSASVAGVGATLIACGLRRWHIAVAISRATGLAGLVTFLASLAILVAVPSFIGSEIDPAQKATLLTQGISEVMNRGALACLAALVSVVLWSVARWRLRSAKVAG